MREANISPERTIVPRFSASLEQALRASDDILELLPVAIYVCDLHGRIVQYNRRAVEIWGRPPRPNQTHDQFNAMSKFFSADGQELPRSKIAEVLKTGVAVRDEEVWVERPTGERVAVLINIDPLLDAHGVLTGAVTCFQDITERKHMDEALDRSRQDLRQQEQRWNATYEHAAIGIAEVDANGRFLRVNEAITTMTGWSREELFARKLFVHTHPADANLDSELYHRQVAGDLDFYSIERRFNCKNGVAIWCSVRSSSVRDSQGKFLYVVRVVQDITERKMAEDRQKLLIDELNHRVKNTLAIVQSLAAQTARGTESPEAFREAFDGRLIALSQAHDQLTRRHWHSAELRDIAAGATTPYLASAPERIELAGDNLKLTPRAALTLAMAFHELTTNAIKYGSLSVPAGRLNIGWRIVRGTSLPPVLWIEWREHGGPAVAEPTREGFGSRFVEGSVAAELHGKAKLHFDAAGLRCTMEIPLDHNLAEPRDGD